jgi:hypothetical protein
MGTIKVNVHDYGSAERVLAGRETVKIGNNTYLVRDVYSINVKYHNTFIASFQPGLATYRTGGWQTYTTKDRLNQLLPPGWRIYQDKYRWYLTSDDMIIEWYDNVRLYTA